MMDNPKLYRPVIKLIPILIHCCDGMGVSEVDSVIRAEVIPVKCREFGWRYQLSHKIKNDYDRGRIEETLYNYPQLDL